MFVTEDLRGVKKIVARLYEFMESERNSSFTVNIDQREASIHNIDQSQSNIGVGSANNVRAQSIAGTVNETYTPTANGQNQDRN